MIEERLPLPLLGFPDERLYSEGVYVCFGKDYDINVFVHMEDSRRYRVFLGREKPIYADGLFVVVSLIEDYRQRKGL